MDGKNTNKANPFPSLLLPTHLGLAPLAPGASDIGQLSLLQAALGPITPAVWPGVAALPDWGKVSFEPAGAGAGLRALLPDAPDDALDLLGSMLRYPPEQRPTAAAALAHPFFTAPPAAAAPGEVAAFVEAALALRKRAAAALAAMGG